MIWSIPRFSQYAPASARVIQVGKRGGCASTPQAFIERLMIAEARAGHRVVRLKGGDPYMFGRGGEERASLRAAGVDVDVVPGISSGLAAPTGIGIPVTHRRYSQGVTFVTGHGKDAASEPNWQRAGAKRPDAGDLYGRGA
jgi:uroporphyrin-III C-methyltransferase